MDDELQDLLSKSAYYHKIVKRANSVYFDFTKWLYKASKSFIDNDYDNSITLYEFASSYKRIYDEFKKEYDELEKLNIGYYNNVIEFIETDTYRMLSLQLNEQEEDSIVPGDEYNRFIIKELKDCKKDAVYGYFLTSSTSISKMEQLKRVDPEVLRGYLDLFGKYYPIFDLFRDMNLGGCRTNTQKIDFNINCTNNSLINNLESMEMILQSDYIFNSDYTLLIHLDLSDGVRIDSNKSIAKLEDYFTIHEPPEIFLKKIIERAIYFVRINRKFLRNYDLDQFDIKTRTR